MKREDELVLEVREGSNEAFAELLKRYRSLIYSIINRYYIVNSDYRLDKDDLFQEGTIALYKAAMSYEVREDILFSTYVYTVIKRRINKKYLRCVNTYNNEAYTTDGVLDYTFATKKYYENPVQLVNYKETINEAKNFLNNLSKEEKDIIKLRYAQYTYHKIADELNISEWHVDYKLRKIRKKLKESEIGRYFDNA